jgi:hypothetical protein
MGKQLIKEKVIKAIEIIKKLFAKPPLPLNPPTPPGSAIKIDQEPS